MQSPALSAACPACPVETTLTLISDKWKGSESCET